MIGLHKKYATYSRALCGGKSSVAAMLLSIGLAALPLNANAQDSLAMVDTGAVASISSVATASSSSAGTAGAAIEPAADPQVPVATESSKSPITGLEPGTLALIGFGLIALAATRRNAR